MTRQQYWNRPGRSSKWITKVRRLAIYIRDGFCCLYCGRDLKAAKPSEVHLDHLSPREAGGSDDPTNLITACRSCNCARQNRAWWKYAPEGAKARIRRHRSRTLNIALARSIINGTLSREDV